MPRKQRSSSKSKQTENRLLKSVGEMTPEKLAKSYRTQAEAEREAGGSCLIRYGLPEIQITMSDDQVFYYQEHHADDVLNEAMTTISDCGMDGLISVEDYLLATYQNA